MKGSDDVFVVAKTEAEAVEKLKAQLPNITAADIRQEEDVLDTWASSWLWPIAVFDGLKHPDNPEINYYYPTNDLVTAPEIMFFWVARMISGRLWNTAAKCLPQRVLHGHRARQTRPQDEQIARQLARSHRTHQNVRRPTAYAWACC